MLELYPDEKLNRLFQETADPERQEYADNLFTVMSRFEPEKPDDSSTLIRASSPHILHLKKIAGSGGAELLQVDLLTANDQISKNIIVSSEQFPQTFALNMGVLNVKQLNLPNEIISEQTAREALSHLETGIAYKDNGDMPGEIAVTRLDSDGTMLLQINRTGGSAISSNSGSLSALFSVSANFTQGTLPVPLQTQWSVWGLALALKIQQTNRQSEEIYKLRARGSGQMTGTQREHILEMLLKLDR